MTIASLAAEHAAARSTLQRVHAWLARCSLPVDTDTVQQLSPFSPPESTGVTSAADPDRSAVYVLGVAGYVLITGTHPWAAFTAPALRHAVVARALPPVEIPDGSPVVRGRLARVIAKATEKDPAARFSEPDELAAEIRTVVAVMEGNGDGAPAIHRDAFERVVRWLESAREGGPTAVHIRGPSGVGKTYLWETIQDAAARPGDRWFYVKAGQGARRPYEAVTQILESAPRETGAILQGGDIPGPLRAFVSAIAPALADGVGRAADYSELQDPADGLSAIIARLAADAAFRVFCFDDFQWIDAYSRTVIERLATRHTGLAVALVTRSDERDPVSDAIGAAQVDLTPLSREATAGLVRSLGYTGDGEVDIDWLHRTAAGNPMAMMALLRSDRPVAATLSGDLLVAVARARIDSLSATDRGVVAVLGLVGTPADLDTLREHSGMPAEELHRGVTDAAAAGLLARGRSSDSVRFVHDSIETAAREAGERDSAARRRAFRVLVAAARAGSDRAAYTAAGFLGAAAEGEVDPADRDWVFVAAARRSVRRLAPEDALRLTEEGAAIVSEAARLQLFAIGHEAAYLLADRHRMSRCFRRIAALGTDEDRAAARYLWVRRCYADARFPGAVTTGVRILTRLAVIDEPFSWDEPPTGAARALRRWRPMRVLRAIERRGAAGDTAVVRATDTLARMVLPTLTADRDRLAVIAYYSLRIAMERGWTAFTGHGFIAWALSLGLSRIPGRWVEPYVRAAERISARGNDAAAGHGIRTLSTVLGAHWTVSYDAFADRLVHLQSEGRALGSWEYVAHALHIHCQTRLYGGAPLPALWTALDDARREIRSFGLLRTDRALSKHHQAVEVLMGRAGDPTRLDGAVFDEASYLKQTLEGGDEISLAGFRVTSALLATFADRPDLAIRHLREALPILPAISLFHDNSVFWFYLGIAAFREGDAEMGRRAVRVLRRWTRQVPATHRHRREFVLGERAASRGRIGAAVRRLRRASGLATAAECISDAALAAERLGDLTGDTRWWLVAEGQYRAWGAVVAAQRVRTKAGLPVHDAPVDPAGGFSGTVSGDTAAVTDVPDLARLVVRRVADLAAAHEVAVDIECGRSDRRWRRTFRIVDGTISGDGPVAADIAFLLDQAEPAVRHVVTAGDGYHRHAPAIVARSSTLFGVNVAVCAAGPDGAAAYAPRVVDGLYRIVSSAVPAAATLMARWAADESEALARSMREELSRTERYRRLLFAAVTDAFLLVDGDTTVVYSNPAATRYLENASRRGGAPELVAGIRDEVSALVRQSEPHRSSSARRVSFDGHHVEIHVQPVSDEVTLTAVSVYDVSAAVEHEQRLAEQERQLIVADRLASIGMFSASIVHEISNPNHILQLNTQSLAVVLSWLNADGENPSVAQARELVGQIEDAAGRIEAVLQVIKSYGREGRNEHWETIDPAAVCSRALRFSRIMASQYTDHLRLTVGEEIPSVWGEPALLEQAVVNLIKNACEALTGRDGIVEVTVAAVDAGRGVRISVCDTGRGFPPGLARRIGEPFVTGRLRDGGTGLGLSIVAGIVDKHRGRITREPSGQFATCVAVTLPAAPPPDESPPSVSTD